MFEKTKKTELYQVIKRRVPDFNEHETILLTSMVALLFKSACADKKVKKCEIKAITKSISSIMGTKDHFIQEIINDTFDLLKKLKKLEVFPYIENINSALNNQEMKLSILETLLYISASDENLSVKEITYCEKVAKAFSINRPLFARIKANTEIELSKRTKEDFSEYTITQGRDKFQI